MIKNDSRNFDEDKGGEIMVKKIWTALLCLTMVFGTIPIGAFAATDNAKNSNNENFAENATVIATSATSPEGEDAAKAFDGNTRDTKWCVTQDSGWIVFSLKNSVQLNQMIVHHAGGSSDKHDREYAGITTKYSLQVLKNEQEYYESPTNEYLSEDTNWQNVAEENNNKERISKETKINLAESHQIYRFKVDDAGSDNCIRVYEIQLFKTKGVGTNNLAENATVIATSAASPNGEDAAKAFDGNTKGTKWCVTQDSGWIVFELKASTKLNQMIVHHAGGSNNKHDREKAGITKKYSLQVLKNEQEYYNNPTDEYLAEEDNWTKVAEETNNEERSAKITTVSMSESHLIYRFKVDDAGADDCIRVYEIQLFNNLAKDAKVMGVSATSPGKNEAADKAFDGNEKGSKWCAIQDRGWLVFDIGTAANIRELIVYHAGAGTDDSFVNTQAYKLQILNEDKCTEEAFLAKSNEEQSLIMSDNSYWTNICAVTDNNDDIRYSLVEMMGNRRIYRFRVTNSGTDNTIRIYEIKLFDKADLPLPEPGKRTPNYKAYVINVENGNPTYSNSAQSSVGTAAQGTKIILTANPAPEGKVFDRWEVLSTETVLEDKNASVTSFIMPDEDVHIRATYRDKDAQPARSITVENGAASISDGTTVTAAVQGTEITLVANAAPDGKVFDRWKVTSGNIHLDDENAETTTFTMSDDDVSVKATYKEDVLTGLEITAEPVQKNYKHRDEFNAKGMIISAVFKSGSKVDVTDKVTYTEKLTCGQTDLNIKYKGQEIQLTGLQVSKADAVVLDDVQISQECIVTSEQRNLIGTAMPEDAGNLIYFKGSENVNGSATVSSWNVDSSGMVKYTITGGAANDVVTLPIIISSDNYEDSTVNVVIKLTLHIHNSTLVTGQPATCTADGWKDYYKCDCGKFFEDAACAKEISDLDAWKNGEGKLAKLEHTLGEWQYDDTDHWKKCSVCGNDVEKAAHSWTIKHDANHHWEECACGKKRNEKAHIWDKGVITKTATCSDDGLKTYTCTNCGETKTEVISATGHKWDKTTYEWSSDGKACTAKRVCKNDSKHIETATAKITSKVTTPANCTEKGKTTYTASFEKTWAAEQTKTIVDIPATGHKWDKTTYEWSSDGKDCTAKRVCKNDSKHIETAAAKITSKLTTSATCTEMGETAYTATFEKTWAAEQTKTIADIPAIGHKWDKTTYEWSSDGKDCTAKRVCKNDSKHIETATAKITSNVTTPATCTEKGKTTYTATFEKTWAAEQIKTIADIPAIGHKWDKTTYEWSSDGKACIAKRVCKNDSKHIETAAAKITSKVTTPATCTEMGETTYMATFNEPWAAKQTKICQDIAVDSHNHDEQIVKINGKAPTNGADGWKDYFKCNACGKFFEDENCTREIADLDDWKTGDGKIDKIGYAIIEGNNSSWQKNTDVIITFRVNGDFAMFTGIKVDGTTVAEENYNAKSGSTIVTLKKAYLQSLSEGSHTITFLYMDGQCKGNFKVTAAETHIKPVAPESNDPANPGKPDLPTEVDTPQTGEEGNIMIWLIMSIASAFVLVALVLYRRKKKAVK